MAAYLTLAQFKLRTTIPPEYIDAIEAIQAGWTDAQLEAGSRWIDSRLRKRYAVPFATPPEIVRVWLSALVTMRVWSRRGFDPTDQSLEQAQDDLTTAKEEIKEAADSEKGLFDLPLSDAATGSAISRSGPLVYSEQSPYVGFDRQSSTARTEDGNGSGTGG